MAITPKSEDKYVEKCSTAQSFVRTEMSTYRIGTLVFGRSNGKDIKLEQWKDRKHFVKSYNYEIWMRFCNHFDSNVQA